jgi:hypothetical protein
VYIFVLLYYEHIMKKDCLSVKTIPQLTPTCWFNSLLMVLLYSDRTRVFFYKKLTQIRTADVAKNVLIETFLHILNHNYAKVRLRKYAAEFNPDELLQKLHDTNASQFYFNPKIDRGHNEDAYLKQLLGYFNLNKNVLYCNSHPLLGKVYVGFANMNFDRTMKNKYPPNSDAREIYKSARKHDAFLVNFTRQINFMEIDVLFVKVRHSESIYSKSVIRYPEGARIYDGLLQETLYIGGFTYVLDGLFLNSLPSTQNPKRAAHAVTGVTCNGKRFLYNGWVDPNTNTNCPLMEFDWFKNSQDFCINLGQCNFVKAARQRKHPGNFFNNSNVNSNTTAKPAVERLCFNMNHSERTYAYVRSDIVQTYWPTINTTINLTNNKVGAKKRRVF